MPRMQEDVSPNVELIGYLHNLVCEHPDFEVLCEPTVDPYCFRYMPNGLAERREEREVQQLLDRLNREIVENVQREGFAVLSISPVRGQVAIRIAISSHRTLRDVEATFEAIARLGRLLTKKQSSSGYELTRDMESMQC